MVDCTVKNKAQLCSGSWHQLLQCHHPEMVSGTAGHSSKLRLEEPDNSHGLSGGNMQNQGFPF